MAKSTITPLQRKFQELPRSVNFKQHILPELEKADISERTFARDRKTSGNSIPHSRLQVYAALFECEVADLIDNYTKPRVKPLVRKSIGAKVGLKS